MDQSGNSVASESVNLVDALKTARRDDKHVVLYVANGEPVGAKAADFEMHNGAIIFTDGSGRDEISLQSIRKVRIDG